MRLSTTQSATPAPAARRGAAARWGVALMLVALAPLVPVRTSTASPATRVEDVERAARPRTAGIVEEVLVARGAIVQEGQVIARLDATEVDHQIEAVSHKLAIVNEDLDSGLRAAARGITNRLEDRRQTLLKRRALECDLRYYQTLRQKLEIRAPVTGRIANRDPQALVGRRTEAGDPLLVIEIPRGEQYL